MYGYVTPHKECLACNDFMLYRSFYCGICKVTGKYYGQFPRLTTNYDMTFLSALLHDLTKTEPEFENKGCILNPFKKKVTVTSNEIFDKIVATNIILSYHKALDGVIDKEGCKMRIAKMMLSRPYKKACGVVGEVDEIAKKWYYKLRDMENQKSSSIDIVADSFASMLKDIVLYLVPTSDEHIQNLCYNIGKFVYIADAIDDIDEDYKKKNYNPFLQKYGDFVTRKQFLADHHDELEFLLACTVNRVIECFNDSQEQLNMSRELCRNIVYVGLRKKCEELLASEKKLKKPVI